MSVRAIYIAFEGYAYLLWLGLETLVQPSWYIPLPIIFHELSAATIYFRYSHCPAHLRYRCTRSTNTVSYTHLTLPTKA